MSNTNPITTQHAVKEALSHLPMVLVSLILSFLQCITPACTHYAVEYVLCTECLRPHMEHAVFRYRCTYTLLSQLSELYNNTPNVTTFQVKQSILLFYLKSSQLTLKSYQLPCQLKLIKSGSRYVIMIVTDYDYVSCDTVTLESYLPMYYNDKMILSIKVLLAFIDFICDEELYENKPLLSMKDPVFKLRESAFTYSNILRRFLATH